MDLTPIIIAGVMTYLVTLAVLLLSASLESEPQDTGNDLTNGDIINLPSGFPASHSAASDIERQQRVG